MNINKKLLTDIFVVILLLFCEWYFFKNVIFTGTGALIGDRGDGRLTNLLVEHWYKFFLGKESFTELAMFYPANDVIGYTDLLMGYGLLYSLIRFLGVNMYAAYKWTLVFIHTVGTLTMYLLLNKKFKTNIIWALLGTVAFSFSDSYARNLGHTQLIALSLLPILLILFISFIENYNIRYKRNIYAFAMLTWFALITYNSWYVACFTGLFVLIFIIAICINMRFQLRRVTNFLIYNIRKSFLDYFLYLLYLIVIYIPFVRMYLPVLSMSSGYSYSTACVTYMPEMVDIINVSESNLLLGRIISNLKLVDRGYSSEVETGFSIVLLLLLIFTMHKCYKEKKNTSNNIRTTIIFGVYATILFSLFSIVRISSNGVSLWYFIYTFVPVTRSIRAVSRYWLWLSFPISVLVAYAGNRYVSYKKNNSIKTVGLLILLLFSNINMNGVKSTWNMIDEMTFVNHISQPPEDMESFYIMDSVNKSDLEYIYQLDAFEIATVYDKKTINGYSGQTPQEWDGIWNVTGDFYEYSVFDWIKTNSLKNVYAYDRGTNSWIPYSERCEEYLGDCLKPSDGQLSLCTGLASYESGEFIWTKDVFEATIKNERIQQTGLKIKMLIEKSKYYKQDENLEPYIKIYVDDIMIEEVDVIDGVVELDLPMESHYSDVYSIRIETNCYFNPSDIGESEDDRDLSLGVYYIGD